MQFRQGKAPAAAFRDGKQVYAFSRGVLETADEAVIALLKAQGAVALDEPAPQAGPEADKSAGKKKHA